MKKKKAVNEKTSFYKRVLGIGIMVTVAVYCIPELQEKVLARIDFIKNEWRKMK